MFNIDSFSEEKKVNGVWKKIDGSESEFLIGSTSNFAFQREFNRLQKPHQKRIKNDNLDPKTSLDLVCEALSKTVLLDWKNVIDGSGKKVKFSHEVAKQALLKNEDLREFVQEVALNNDNFQADLEEDEAKS